ncbi:DUF5374 domain-containing protein [Pasteurella skyensis]|uniref:DUF5374 domain-containing protein n=1 Tax=Phocoenobacter skyensis TaxID=97481 RepID=A0AAJ6NFA7_9PAST|nr:DUF5374 domain-containing protein [Pasteurella skyensis]MDP8171417.1 DUF5374 domain-containing protein [Pasteurella skyensis]MDP8175611.1 DUF5374 domain-containing protein [Pasteurella skyensis]
MGHLLKAETFVSLLTAIVLFSIMLFSYTQWQKQQNKSEILLYQRLQAMQVAENQISLKMANLPCESSFLQNDITFNISCQTNSIKVTFPLGEFHLKP